MSKRKSLLTLLVALSFVLISSVMICAAQASPVSAYASTPTQPQKTIELKWSHFLPPNSGPEPAWRGYASKVEELTKGRVKFTFYPAEGLHKGSEFYSAVTKGITDITLGVMVYDPSRFPLTLIMDVPLMGWPEPIWISSTKIYAKLYDEFPEIRNETKQVKLLGKWTSSPRALHFSNKNVVDVPDLKGLKVAAGGMAARTMEFLGGTPVMIMPPDYYMSLDRGTVQGIATAYHVVHEFKVLPLLRYHTNADFGMNTMFLMMNQEKWNSLPQDAQKIMNDLSPALEQESMKYMMVSEDAALKYVAENKHEVVRFTRDRQQKWIGAAKPVHEKWIENTEAKKLPARAVYERVQHLIKEYK